MFGDPFFRVFGVADILSKQQRKAFTAEDAESAKDERRRERGTL